MAYVRPEKLTGMAASSVRKKMKQKSFAAAVKREDIGKAPPCLACRWTITSPMSSRPCNPVAADLGFA